VAAAAAVVLLIANLIAALVSEGDGPPVAAFAAYSVVMLVMAWGLWRVRYWAVLGMQAMLGILIVFFSLLALRASNVLGALVGLLVIVLAGTLFWFLVKAMARIQMPVRR